MAPKIAFIQEERSPHHGIMSIAGVLKEHSFTMDVFSIEIEQTNIVSEVLKFNPDIIGLSVMTPGLRNMMKVASVIKEHKPDVFMIMGGAHPTFYPEVLASEKDLDAICIGEGEYAMLELAISMRNNELDYNIENLWFKQEKNIKKNELRMLVADLNELPFPNRDIYFSKYPFLANDTIRFMIGRGCPFNCSYCFNKGMKKLYKDKGSWLRFKAPERMIEEIKEVNNKYPIKWVSFIDDTFNASKKRLKEFLLLYKNEINIPFVCQLRVDIADEEQIELLYQTGVDRVTIGVEHGDEIFRKKVLNRNIPNTQLLAFGQWIQKRRIRLFTQNIIGFPGESVNTALTTIELNAKLKPELAVSNILSPYPGTEIYEYAANHNAISASFDFNTMSGHNTAYGYNNKAKSDIKNENMKELLNLRCFFMVLVHHPWLTPLVRVMIKLPYNRFYEFIWQITGTTRISWRYADRNERKSLVRKLMHILAPSIFKDREQ